MFADSATTDEISAVFGSANAPDRTDNTQTFIGNYPYEMAGVAVNMNPFVALTSARLQSARFAKQWCCFHQVRYQL